MNQEQYIVWQLEDNEDRKNFQVVNGNDIFELLDNAKEDGKKIIVYKLGKCLIDWT